MKEAFPWQQHLDMFSRHGRDRCGVCSETQHLGIALMKTIQTSEKNGNISRSVIITECGFPFLCKEKKEENICYEFLFQCISDTSNLENPPINCLNYRNHLSRFFTATLLSFSKALPQVRVFTKIKRLRAVAS